MANLNIPWVEKYRPAKLSDVILDPATKKIIEHIIEEGTDNLTNMFFAGSPGTGKCHAGDQEIEIYVDKKTYDILKKKEN